MKILFLCHGNINRSAVAELIGKKIAPWHEYKSAGLKTKNGRIMAKKMRHAWMEIAGGPEPTIRSTVCTRELMEWADVIFYMDPKNAEKIYDQFGIDFANKTNNLAHQIDASKIPDPNYEKDNKLHKEVIKMITFALEKYIGQYEDQQNKLS